MEHIRFGAMYFTISNVMKNLLRHRRRYLLLGSTLLFMIAVFSSAVVVFKVCDAGQTADIALRIAWASGLLLIIMICTANHMTIAVRQREIAVMNVLGIGSGLCMTGLGLELFVFSTGCWLIGSATGALISAMLGFGSGMKIFAEIILNGIGVSGLILLVQIFQTACGMRKKTLPVMMKGED